jgi:hypothetical protein
MAIPVAPETGAAAYEHSAGSNRPPTGVQRDGKEGQVYHAIEREKTTGCNRTDSQKSDEKLAELLDQQEHAEAEAEKKRKHEEFLASEELLRKAAPRGRPRSRRLRLCIQAPEKAGEFM